MAKASTSHGSHAVCEPRSLALRNPAKCSLPSRVTYRVAPIPGFRTAPSQKELIHTRTRGPNE